MFLVENLHVQAGDFALKGISFEVPTGAYAVLMGRTGAGKTTLLEAICGLKKVTAGRIVLMDRDVTHRKPAARGIGFVPQDGALFGTMTVRGNLAFSLELRNVGRPEIERRVEELAGLLGIGHFLDRMPGSLSGGEKQRTALGRALAFRPNILCLDEPFSSLDEQTREEMYALVKSVQKAAGVTTLHITHNPGETEKLADRVLVLEEGRLSVRG